MSNNSPTQSTSNERKFHDAWAFYMFIIFSIAMNTFYFIKTANPVDSATKLVDQYNLIGVVLANFAYVMISIMLALILFYLAPKFLIVLSIFTIPALSIYGFISSNSYSAEYGFSLGVVLFIFNLILLIVGAYAVFSHMDYIAACFTIASRLFYKNLFGVVFLQICCLTLMIISLIPVSLVDSTDTMVKLFKYVIILQILWLSGIISYFMEVFISSVIFFEIKKSESSVFSSALKNSMYALGSVSLAALLVAFINTLKLMVSDARERQRNEQRPNLLLVIILAIAGVILSIMGDILEFANAITFPYLSVHGTDYKESVVQSFELLSSSGLEPIAAMIGIDFVIITISLGSVFGIYLFNNFYLFNILSVGVSGNEKIAYLAILTALFGFYFYFTISLMRSAILALIFTAASHNADFKTFDPKFAAALEREKNKHMQKPERLRNSRNPIATPR